MATAVERTVREDRRELSEAAPGTLMGAVLRRVWQPIALSKDVAAGRAITVRALGEDFTLYRGRSGTPYLVAQRCAHRSSLLQTGWVEGEHIRCRYHGWKYDGGGQCVEMPAEDATFPAKVRIGHHPVADYAGVVFAYLGADEPPPMWCLDELNRGYGVQWASKMVWPCNWFQLIENFVDPVHVSFVHQDSSFGESLSYVVPKLDYEETPWGIRLTATRSADNVRTNEFFFPNCGHVMVPVHVPGAEVQPWADVFNWFVPLDDGHVAYYSVRSAPFDEPVAARFRTWLDSGEAYDFTAHEEELFRGEFPTDAVGSTGSTVVNAQDYVALVGQGAVVDRTQERLGKSDEIVIYLRKLFFAEFAALRNGTPGKAWQMRRGFARLPVPPNVPLAPDPLHD